MEVWRKETHTQARRRDPRRDQVSTLTNGTEEASAASRMLSWLVMKLWVPRLLSSQRTPWRHDGGCDEASVHEAAIRLGHGRVEQVGACTITVLIG